MDIKRKPDGIEDTLYIPLTSRIFVSERFPEFFYDEKAVSLKPHVRAESLESRKDEYFHMASACRQYSIDRSIMRFLEDHDDSNVVFLGSGLETAYDRIGNTTSNFYQIDLPEVIELRKRILGNSGNETLIAGDMFALEWVKYMDTTLPTMIVVSGVYQYFHENEIIDMIKAMKDIFSKGELVFDAISSDGLEMANKYVERTGNMNAKMYFNMDDPDMFAQRTGTELISVDGFYSDALKKCKHLRIKTRIYMYFADKWHRTLLVHLRFNAI